MVWLLDQQEVHAAPWLCVVCVVCTVWDEQTQAEKWSQTREVPIKIRKFGIWWLLVALVAGSSRIVCTEAVDITWFIAQHGLLHLPFVVDRW